MTLELVGPGPVETVDDDFDVTHRHGNRAGRSTASFIARRLARSEVITCASPEYLDRRGRPQHPHELAEHEC